VSTHPKNTKEPKKSPTDSEKSSKNTQKSQKVCRKSTTYARESSPMGRESKERRFAKSEKKWWWSRSTTVDATFSEEGRILETPGDPSARSNASEYKHMFGPKFGGADLDPDASWYYPDEVRRVLSRGAPQQEESGWSRREKLLLVLLVFTAIIVLVLFLIVFLVMAGVLGQKTEVAQNAADASKLVMGSEQFPNSLQFHFTLLARTFCYGGGLETFGSRFSGRAALEQELNFAIANDLLFALAYRCEPGLPMAGTNRCSLWEADTYEYNYDYYG
ncbi:hypothetical protein BaRGS_00022030, partial [Batillaria attramentaria]